jgi:hypothetical protein
MIKNIIVIHLINHIVVMVTATAKKMEVIVVPIALAIKKNVKT